MLLGKMQSKTKQKSLYKILFLLKKFQSFLMLIAYFCANNFFQTILSNYFMTVKTISIGCDHAGFDYKDPIIQYLKNENIEVIDFGANSTNSVDYPDFAHPTAEAVQQRKADLGIVLCGSGNGVAITANKHQNVRCALCWSPEIATLARQHNDANMISIPARFITLETALQVVEQFISTDFEGGRHVGRVMKIACH